MFKCLVWSDVHLNVSLLSLNRCTKIINADSEDPKYIINVKQFAKFVVDLSDQVAPTDIEEGMRVGSGLLICSFDCLCFHQVIVRDVSGQEFLKCLLLLFQCGQEQVPDPHPSASENRPHCHHDAGKGSDSKRFNVIALCLRL